MTEILIWGHLVLGAVAVLVTFAPARLESPLSRLLASVGVLGAVALGVEAVEGQIAWRAVELERHNGTALAIGGAVAWVAVFLRVPNAPGLTGAVAVGMLGALGAVGGGWVIPTLLFFACVAAAACFELWSSGPRSSLLACVLAAVLTGAVIGVSSVGWRIPQEAGYAYAGSIAPALLLLAWVVGRHLAAEGSLPPATSLLFLTTALLALGSTDPLPWLGVGFVAAALAAGLLSSRSWGSAAGVWPWAALTALGVAAAHPPALPGALVAAASVGLAAMVFPRRRTVGWVPLVLTACVLPLAPGFAVLAAGFSQAFDRQSAAATPADSAPWMVFTILLALSLGISVWLSARLLQPVLGTPPDTSFLRPGLVGVLALAAGALPRHLLGLPEAPLGAEGGVALLFLVASVVAIGAGWVVYGREDATIARVEESVGEVVAFDPPLLRELPLAGVLSVISIAAAGAALIGFTVAGLRVGFL